MYSFKQKLKKILNDSYSFKEPINMEQKLDQIILKTFRKIKKDNNRQSILWSNYKNNSIKLNQEKSKKKVFFSRKREFVYKWDKRDISKNSSQYGSNIKFIKK